MTRHRMVWGLFSIAGLAMPGPLSAQPFDSPSGQATSPSTRNALPPGSVEVRLLQSLQANPATSIYAFSTERRQGKVALRGRVGTKQAHDSAIQVAIALGVPVIDDLVIDTLAAHQAAAYSNRMAMGMNPGSAGPSSGFGGYPGATSLYGNLPYTYPQPLFGRLDEPFYGFEPPSIGYPPWWAAMSARRVGTMDGPAAGGVQAQAAGPSNSLANSPNDPANAQAINLPDGTIDMAIDARGVATLRGAVPSLAERITLGQKVAQTPGVTQVINLLNVKPGISVVSVDKPPPPPVPADIAGALPKPSPQPLNPNGRPGLPEGADPVAERASKAIANRAGLGDASVKVKVRDGVASISGTVPTVYEAMLAYRAVQRTPGVREVEDRLEFVVPDGSSSNPLADRGRPEDVEPYLEAQIRRQLGDFAHLDRVRAQGNSLDLRGTIDREEDRTRFDAILRSMPILRGFRITADMPAESR